MARVYATSQNLQDGLPDGLEMPPDATRMLTSASRELDRVLMSMAAVYDTDTAGLPTDSAVTTVLRDATVALAVFWLETGDESGAAAALQSASAGGPSWSGHVPRVGPAVLTILRTAVDSTGSPLLSGPLT